MCGSSALIQNQMQTYTWGHSLDQRSTNTTNVKFHTSSQTLPLPTHALPDHLHYFTKDCHHLYFLSTWFVYDCDIWIYVSIINIYFTKKFEYKFNKKTRQTCDGKRGFFFKVTILKWIWITVQPHCQLLLQHPFKLKTPLFWLLSFSINYLLMPCLHRNGRPLWSANSTEWKTCRFLRRGPR